MRVLIWVVVGVVAVVGIGALVYMRSQDNKVLQAGIPTPEEIKQVADRLVKQADKYLADIQKMREDPAIQAKKDGKALLDELEAIAKEIKEKASKLPATPAKQVLNARRDIQDLQQDFKENLRSLKTAQ